MGWKQLESQLKKGSSSDPVRIVPFLTVGFPDVEATLELVPVLEQAGTFQRSTWRGTYHPKIELPRIESRGDFGPMP